jgi:hypothetical protein
VEGVAVCGGGKWADIKKLGYPAIAARSAVDLKDKWRNLLRIALLPNPPTPKVREREREREMDLKNEWRNLLRIALLPNPPTPKVRERERERD